MRILIATQIYPPEMGALSNRLYPIVRSLVGAGHEVSVATGMPNYPEGVVFPGYRGRRFVRERIEGATVLRTAYATAPRNQSRSAQLRSYLSFVPAVIHSGLRAGPVDVVFATSPPIFPLAAAMLLARVRGARLVCDIRDLWPDELITYGGARDGSPGIRLIRCIERAAYRAADCISGTSYPILDTIVERGGDRSKTFFLPNGADLDLFRPLPPENPIAAEYGFGDRFVVMYSGLFGIKHGLELLLEAARLLRSQPDILFFLIGNGARREALEREVREAGLDNVRIARDRPISDLPWVLARADACFAAVRPEPYPKKVISVKVFEYLACEKPVVGAVSGESARIIEEAGGGVVVPPGDAAATAQAIRELYHLREMGRSMGRRGRRYVEENYSRAYWADQFERCLSRSGWGRRGSAALAAEPLNR